MRWRSNCVCLLTKLIFEGELSGYAERRRLEQAMLPTSFLSTWFLSTKLLCIHGSERELGRYRMTQRDRNLITEVGFVDGTLCNLYCGEPWFEIQVTWLARFRTNFRRHVTRPSASFVHLGSLCSHSWQVSLGILSFSNYIRLYLLCTLHSAALQSSWHRTDNRTSTPWFINNWSTIQILLPFCRLGPIERSP